MQLEPPSGSALAPALCHHHHQKAVATAPCSGQNQNNRVCRCGDFHHRNVRGNGAKTMANNPAAERGLKLLEKCALFGALDDKARRELAAHAHPRHFAAGDAICRIDEHGDSMMAVVLGVVRISLPVARGKEIILADLRAGEMFGEIALLDGKPRSANATAPHQLRADGSGAPRRAAVPRAQSGGLHETDGNTLRARFAAPTSACRTSPSSTCRRGSPRRC